MLLLQLAWLIKLEVAVVEQVAMVEFESELEGEVERRCVFVMEEAFVSLDEYETSEELVVLLDQSGSNRCEPMVVSPRRQVNMLLSTWRASSELKLARVAWLVVRLNWLASGLLADLHFACCCPGCCWWTPSWA